MNYLIPDLSEEDIRAVLEQSEETYPIPWPSVLKVAETSGMTDVMIMLDRQVEGTDSDGFSPGDIGRALERELRVLLCTNDPKYKQVRVEISKTKKSAREIGIAIATAIAGSWHLQAGLLTPFVLVGLLVIVKLGKESWCAGKPIESVNGLERPAKET